SLIGPNRLTIFIEAHHHGRSNAKKHWAKGQPCPVAVCYGGEEALFEASVSNQPPGASEYDYAGWLRGAPVPVVTGEITGLPIPATAEIVIEGFIPPVDEEGHVEGPFREWPGYYTQSPALSPVIRVEAIYHRNDPILMGRPAESRTMSPPTIPGAADTALQALDRAGIPGVKGAWAFMNTLFVVVSLEQLYAGHSKAALAAAAGTRTSGSANRFYVVVDEDIDPSDMNQVLWALCTRVEPSEQVDIIRNMRSGEIDPIVSPEKRAEKNFTTSIMLIDACKPFAWKEKFGKSLPYTDDFLSQVRAKWGSTLGLPYAV
ncbi:MAG: UbiD family decarboxylase, partial [Dehalococcoidia bacterium]|nr:UbiD family decarboxylase [Dehalococcoidia bacterium]